jgi:uncharacterized protein with gpF-like domain
MATLRAPTKKPIRLAAVRPNPGVTKAYRDRLDAELRRMQADIVREIERTWRSDPPEMAQDASPAAMLMAALRRLRSRWETGFARLADRESRRFTAQATGHAERSFKAMLRKAGFTVRFQMTREANDVLRATIGEQVGLIKSIASEHLTRVEGMVMRSVQTGRDIGGLKAELQGAFGISSRRAELIARDQNNKATATITRVRQQEIGIQRARWLHSGGGKSPRPSHVKASQDRVTYDITKGWFDPDEQKFIFPGQLVSCRCVSIPIIPGIDGQQ